MTSNGSALAGGSGAEVSGGRRLQARKETGATLQSEKGVTSPWVARTAVFLAVGSFALWILYAWNIVPGLKVLGAFNYLIAMVMVLGAAILMRFWRGA